MERNVEMIMPVFPKQPSLLRVAAYARVSVEKEAMHHSLAAQVSYYNEYIQKNPEWIFCGVYTDEAKTGTRTDRQGFQKMLTDCRNGKLDLIVTKSISRFARNTVALLETVRELKSLGIGVYFEEQNINTLDGTGELMMTILASFAQEESRSASENMKWRICHAFEEGQPITLRHLYGYTITKHSIEINEEQAMIVREIFTKCNEGWSFTKIAKNLNERNIPYTWGGKWNPSRINDVLSNEKYTGNLLLMKTYRNNHIEKLKLKNNGELPMYYVENSHPAIISQEVFDKAQLILEHHREEHQNYAPPKYTEFTGLIQCGICGAKYKKRRQKFVFWDCRTCVENGKSECPGCRLPEEQLIPLVNSVTEDTSNILKITAKEYILTFYLSDGRIETRQWQKKERVVTWTPEMREQAAIYGKKRWSCDK